MTLCIRITGRDVNVSNVFEGARWIHTDEDAWAPFVNSAIVDRSADSL